MLGNQIGLCSCVRNDGNAEALGVDFRNSEADAVYGNRAFFNNKAQDGSITSNAIPHGIVILVDAFHGTHTVDMARNDMTAETSTSEHGALQVHGASRAQRTQRRTVQGFVHDIGRKATARKTGYGKANTIGCNAVTQMNILKHLRSCNGKHAGMGTLANGSHFAHFFHNAGEHLPHLAFNEQISTELCHLWIGQLNGVLGSLDT